MNDTTKKRIMALFVVGIFVLSSVAFFAIGGFSQNRPTPTEPLASFVVDGPLSREIESTYISNGFTVMRYYYSDDSLIGYVNGLSDGMKTLNGQNQLIIEKIRSNETYAVIESAVNRTVVNAPNESSVFNTLCNVIFFKPSACLINSLPL